MEKEKLIETLNLIDKDDVLKVKELVAGASLFTANTLLCYSAENNAVNTLKFFLSADGIEPAIQDNYAIRIAAAKGNDECVKILAADSRVDKSVLDDENLKITLPTFSKDAIHEKIETIYEDAVEEIVEGNTATVVDENISEDSDEEEELPEIEEDVEDVEDVEETLEEDTLDELLDELDASDNVENVNGESERNKSTHRKVVIDKELTSNILKNLGAKKKTKQAEEELFSEVEKNLQKTVASTLNDATPEYYE